MRGPLVTAAVVGGLTLALHVRDPHASGSWGLCPFRLLTGLDCPGCGSLRAVNDLTNGDLTAAASSNLLFVLMVPVLVLWWLRWAGRAWSGTPSRELTAGRARVLAVTAGVVALVFWVVRNTPWGAWLHS
jgi:hypothetical protein